MNKNIVKIISSRYIGFILAIAVSALALSGCSTTTNTGSGNQVASDTNTCTINSDNPYGVVIGENPNLPYPMTESITGNNPQFSVLYKYLKAKLDSDGNPLYTDGKLATEEVSMPEMKYSGVGYAYISNTKLSEGSHDDCNDNHIHTLTGEYANEKCKEQLPYSNIVAAGVSSGDAYFMRLNYRNEKLDVDSKDLTSEAEMVAKFVKKITESQNPDIIGRIDKTYIYDVLFVPNENHTKNCGKKENGTVFDIIISQYAQNDFTKEQKYRLSSKAAVYTDAQGNSKVADALSIKQILEHCGNNLSTLLATPKAEEIKLGTDSSNTAVTADKSVPPSAIDKSKVASLGLDDDKYLSYTGGTEINDHEGSSTYKEDMTNTASVLSEIKKIKGLEKATAVSLLKTGNKVVAVKINLPDTGWVQYAVQTAQTTFTTPDCNTSDSDSVNICNVEVSPSDNLGDAPWCGFTPECKPAIYLYPTKSTNVNVKIGPSSGIRTVTIPEYDSVNGWDVTANKKGDITLGGQKFSHLFYEALTPTPNIPKTGWVIDGAKLKKELFKIARESQFNRKESKEFANYWSSKLKISDFYFVGWVSGAEIDAIEPITITPAPDTLWRVRYYFIPLQDRIDVQKPNIGQLNRNGFTAVEWGGWTAR